MGEETNSLALKLQAVASLSSDKMPYTITLTPFTSAMTHFTHLLQLTHSYMNNRDTQLKNPATCLHSDFLFLLPEITGTAEKGQWILQLLPLASGVCILQVQITDN